MKSSLVIDDWFSSFPIFPIFNDHLNSDPFFHSFSLNLLQFLFLTIFYYLSVC
jgi:hypothetical protein